MESKVKAYLNSELHSNEITKEIVISAYMNEYPKKFLYEYPSFFLNKLSKQNLPSEATQKAILLRDSPQKVTSNVPIESTTCIDVNAEACACVCACGLCACVTLCNVIIPSCTTSSCDLKQRKHLPHCNHNCGALKCTAIGEDGTSRKYPRGIARSRR